MMVPRGEGKEREGKKRIVQKDISPTKSPKVKHKTKTKGLLLGIGDRRLLKLVQNVNCLKIWPISEGGGAFSKRPKSIYYVTTEC